MPRLSVNSDKECEKENQVAFLNFAKEEFHLMQSSKLQPSAQRLNSPSGRTH